MHPRGWFDYPWNSVRRCWSSVAAEWSGVSGPGGPQRSPPLPRRTIPCWSWCPCRSIRWAARTVNTLARCRSNPAALRFDNSTCASGGHVGGAAKKSLRNGKRSCVAYHCAWKSVCTAAKVGLLHLINCERYHPRVANLHESVATETPEHMRSTAWSATRINDRGKLDWREVRRTRAGACAFAISLPSRSAASSACAPFSQLVASVSRIAALNFFRLLFL